MRSESTDCVPIVSPDLYLALKSVGLKYWGHLCPYHSMSCSQRWHLESAMAVTICHCYRSNYSLPWHKDLHGHSGMWELAWQVQPDTLSTSSSQLLQTASVKRDHEGAAWGQGEVGYDPLGHSARLLKLGTQVWERASPLDNHSHLFSLGAVIGDTQPTGLSNLLQHREITGPYSPAPESLHARKIWIILRKESHLAAELSVILRGICESWQNGFLSESWVNV